MPGGLQIAAEWLFDDDALKAGEIAVGLGRQPLAEASDDPFENLRRGGDVKQAIAAGVVGFVQFLEPGGQTGMIVRRIVCAGHIEDVRFHAFPDGFVDRLMPGVFFDGVIAVLAVLLIGEGRTVLFLLGSGVADEDESVADEVLAAKLVDRGDELELGQIAAGAEDDDCTRDGVGFVAYWDGKLVTDLNQIAESGPDRCERLLVP